MEVNEQPLAPYLDAVVAYAFRGPARFHVPGHKGGPGADPDLLAAIGEREQLDIQVGELVDFVYQQLESDQTSSPGGAG